MSKYIPQAAVAYEQFMQHQRRQYGLKVGSYVLWPNVEVGPLVVLAHKVLELNTAQAGKLLEYYTKEAAKLIEKAKTLEPKND